MLIKQESIKDISDDFRDLQKSMMGWNYVVEFDARVFSFEDDNRPFDITCLRKVYYDTVPSNENDLAIKKNSAIDGTVMGYFFDNSIQEINTAIGSLDGMNFHSHPQFDQVTQTITTNMQTFWQIIQARFTIMWGLQVFIHKPDWGSFFKTGMMWEFCFIFINNKTNQGLVLAGSAFD